jgi:CheY-like chemotaxis protein
VSRFVNPRNGKDRPMTMGGDSAPPIVAAVDVLVVDDDAELRDSIRMTLELEGYRVVTAADGREALSCIEQRRPDLVLLDLAMPGMNGWELHDRLRTCGLDLLVVFMTGWDHVQTEAARHQPAGYLTKPFAVDDLLETVAYFTSV